MIKLKPILISVAVIGALSLGWAALLSVLPAPFEASWIAGLYDKKEAAAAAEAEPKYVIVGGSGAHYSYSAEEASRLTGLPVYNLGSHAGLGLDYILDRARKSLRPGDTAILALEYHVIEGSRATSILSPFVLTEDPGYLLRAPTPQLLNLLFGYPPIDVVKQVAATTVPWTSPLYRVDAVSAFGDETANTKANKQPHMEAALAESGLIPAYPRDPASPPEALVEFADWARANRVNLVMAWPVALRREEYKDPRYQAYFSRYAQTFSDLGARVLNNNVSDYLLPLEMMLDSNFHADADGAKAAGRQLAEDLTRAGLTSR